MGRTACTEPQCLYKGDLYIYLYFIALEKKSRNHEHEFVHFYGRNTHMKCIHLMGIRKLKFCNVLQI